MEKQYISSNYPDMLTASGKAKTDGEDIMVGLGYANVGIKRSFYPIGWKSYISVIRNFITVYLKMKKDGIVFLQYPLPWTLKNLRLAKKRKNNVVVLIHDLNILRNGSSKEEISILNEADVLIVHTPAMKKFLKENGLGRKTVVLECFDYLYGKSVKIPDLKDGFKVAFTGNLKKSDFLDKVNLEKVKLNLYGIGIENRTLPDNVHFIGCFPPEKLAENMGEHFGLVWDGESPDTCSGQLGEYLKIIAPHKFSMYVSAGLPVVVWNQSALAPLVEQKKIGLAVGSLREMEDKIFDLTEKEYKEMLDNVNAVKDRLIKGDFLRTAITEAESLIR